MKRLTTKEVIERLEKKGHRVTWRRRSDGGILITKIDNTKYKGAKGNNKGRDLIGATKVSEKRLLALEKLTQRHIEKVRRVFVDELLKKQLKKTQRTRLKYHRTKEGKVTKKRLSQYIEAQGKDRALEYLKNRERYYKGLAYDENINFLTDRIRREANLKGNKDYLDLIDIIESRKNFFREEWISKINDIMYSNVDDATKIKRIKSIIGA